MGFIRTGMFPCISVEQGVSVIGKRKWQRVATRPGYWVWVCACWACAMCVVEGVQHWRDSRYVDTIAKQVVRDISPEDVQARVIALREYLRANVTFQDAVYERREFFRVSASQTLQSGKGYCGEVTRAFIRLAQSLGIRAKRVYLYGRVLHVVAEVELGEAGNVIVDCQNPPQVDGLPTLKQVMQRPEYDTYSNLNVRRLGLHNFLTGITVRVGLLNHWLESPYLLRAIIWGSLAIVIGFTRLMWLAGRALWRCYSHSSQHRVRSRPYFERIKVRIAQEV